MLHVNLRLCETVGLAFFSARPRFFEFLNGETKIETPKTNGFAKHRTDLQNHSKNETARPVKFD